MHKPEDVVPKLLDLKHKNQVRRLGAVMSELRLIEGKQKELAEDRAKLDQDEDGFTRISLQNGYARYLHARGDALTAQAKTLREQANALQKSLKETMCSQSILRENL